MRTVGLFGLILTCCTSISANAQEARSAILLIGDGMGMAHVTAARILKANARDGTLSLDRFKQVAFVRTYSDDFMVTDSGAAATALATGHKTRYGYVGSAPDGSDLDTVLERAKAAGKSVGIVTTARVTHATPAAFYASLSDRDDEGAIAVQLIEYGKIDVIMGGGREFFLPSELRDEESRQPGSRTDDRNLMQDAEAAGYRIVQRSSDLAALEHELESGRDPGKILGLFNHSKMEYAYRHANDRWGEPSLAEMTEVALSLLSRNPKGFFLMVEGALIDHASHENWGRAALEEVLAFDAAVHVAQTFAESHPDTLVVATADHETGGLAINGYAPTSVGGLDVFTEEPAGGASEVLSFSSGPGANRRSVQSPSEVPVYRQPALHEIAGAAHTGADVPAWAAGPGSERIHGTMDNHEVGRAINDALLGTQ